MLHEEIFTNFPENLGGLLHARPVAFRRRRACKGKLSQAFDNAQRRGGSLNLGIKDVGDFPLHEFPECPSHCHALITRPLELDGPSAGKNLHEQNAERVDVALGVQLERIEILGIQVTCYKVLIRV